MESTANELESGQQLIEAVRKQVEYYFSKENLQSDPYLTSQMDASMSVPISVVMKVLMSFYIGDLLKTNSDLVFTVCKNEGLNSRRRSLAASSRKL